MLRNARITAHWDDGPVKAEEAIRQVHLAMYRSALGLITEDEREQILTVLRPCCPEVFVSLPVEEPQDLASRLAEEPFVRGASAKAKQA